VGCDNEGEGEYYSSRTTKEDIVVIWLKFSVDNKIYQFRTLNQFSLRNDKELNAFSSPWEIKRVLDEKVVKAIEKSFIEVTKAMKKSISSQS
ncbi:MAG: hypothetical protein OIF32_11705, partial [Campylobacterales bacterium]|nr:hypothetical protein [Campylobacterales bacterium]